MNKRITALLAAVMLTGSGFAQDQLFKNDNTRLLVKIVEITPYDIKYKLFDNLTGPDYTESKSDFSLVIYENGKHEVLSQQRPTNVLNEEPEFFEVTAITNKADSLSYFRHSENISVNFLPFINNEFALMYQKDFFRNHFNLIVPVAVGIAKPGLTQQVYFSGANDRITLRRKQFEAGLGINYYPSLKHNYNYFIGPCARYMQYDAVQTYTYRLPNPNGSFTTYTGSNNVTLTRYCLSITNGFILRTKSRIVLMAFASLGFKNDVVVGEASDPNGATIKPLSSAASVYFWSGFNVGFSF